MDAVSEYIYSKSLRTMQKFVSQYGAVWSTDGTTILCNKLHIGHEFCNLLMEAVRNEKRVISG